MYLNLREIRGRERILLGVLGYRLELDWECVWWLWKGDTRMGPATQDQVHAWEKVLYLPLDNFNEEIQAAKDWEEARERRRGFTHLPGRGAEKG